VSVLLGHPTGNPNSYHAALAYFETGRLEALCVPWMPSATLLRLFDGLPALRLLGRRLARRRFAPLADAPKVQGRAGEWRRLAGRLFGLDHERLVHDANGWLMRTMQRECRRPAVEAVHCYEDCALLPFQEAKRLGKACIYDLPTICDEAWQPLAAVLARRYAEWRPRDAASSPTPERIEQKRQELALADVVLVPSLLAEASVRQFHPHKKILRIPYGVDLSFWTPPPDKKSRKLRFIYAGQISVRKGMPVLIEAWKKAALRDAELELVGSWHLAAAMRATLPAGIVHRPPCAPDELRERYRAADVFVSPSFAEGFGLSLLEGMASGLPALASETGIAPEIITPASGRLVSPGDVDALVDALRAFSAHRDDLPVMGRTARQQAGLFTWERYRSLVAQVALPHD
jgi:glycosyltransferase involved in cell wall biosynthesis